jgi:Flp pilus assembly protein TadB
MTEDNGQAIKRIEQLIAERDRYYNSRFEAAKEAVNLALSAAEKAVVKAESASEKRQDASNEIRAAMIDQQKSLANKSETELRFRVLEQKIEELDSYRYSTAGHVKGVSDLWGWIIAAVTVVGSFLVYVIHGGH